MNQIKCWSFSFLVSATSEIYSLSLHDALPISCRRPRPTSTQVRRRRRPVVPSRLRPKVDRRRPRRTSLRRRRSEEHTSELQSQSNLVCRLLLEKKNSTIRVGLTTIGQLLPEPQ